MTKQKRVMWLVSFLALALFSVGAIGAIFGGGPAAAVLAKGIESGQLERGGVAVIFPRNLPDRSGITDRLVNLFSERFLCTVREDEEKVLNSVFGQEKEVNINQESVRVIEVNGKQLSPEQQRLLQKLPQLSLRCTIIRRGEVLFFFFSANLS